MGGTGGQTGGWGEMEEETTVERDGNRRIGASHPIIITVNNNNKKKVNSKDSDNHETKIIIVLI